MKKQPKTKALVCLLCGTKKLRGARSRVWCGYRVKLCPTCSRQCDDSDKRWETHGD